MYDKFDIIQQCSPETVSDFERFREVVRDKIAKAQRDLPWRVDGWQRHYGGCGAFEGQRRNRVHFFGTGYQQEYG